MDKPKKHLQTVDGYDYVGCSDSWKQACSKLACFHGLHWPGYDTKVIEAKIDGKDIVIQLWKGHCQKFLGIDDAPGGIGAEVGVYRRIGDRAFEPKKLPKPLGIITKAFQESMSRSPLWWPYPELNAKLSFELIHPKSGKVFFAAGPDSSYWCCKWMNPDSYKRFGEAAQQSGEPVPASPTDYRLKFKVNGKDYVWD